MFLVDFIIVSVILRICQVLLFVHLEKQIYSVYSLWGWFQQHGGIEPVHFKSFPPSTNYRCVDGGPQRPSCAAGSLKSLFTVAKPRLHLYKSPITEPKPKGRQPLSLFTLLFAAIVLFARKSSCAVSDISIISPLWLALEAWGESAGILKDSFGLQLTASSRDFKRSAIDFFSLFGFS